MSDTLVLNDFDQLGIPPADAALSVIVYTKLIEHYPGHRWQITADHRGGYVFIQLPYNLPWQRRASQHGQVVYIDTLKGDPGMRAIVKAGGEMLERYGLPRHRYRVDDDIIRRAQEHGLDLTR